ncbi:MAG: hypothetical protein ABIJ53_04465, partial [Verrucomicrobiota bacterium]
MSALSPDTGQVVGTGRVVVRPKRHLLHVAAAVTPWPPEESTPSRARLQIQAPAKASSTQHGHRRHRETHF